MCGRFTLTAPRVDVARFLAAETGGADDLADDLSPFEASWNIAPTQAVVTVIEGGCGRRLLRL